MKNYAFIYYFYNHFLTKLIRFLLLIVLIAIFLNSFLIIPQNIGNFRLPLFMLGIFVLFELFFRFKICRINPYIKVKDNKNELLESFTLKSWQLYFESFNLESLTKDKSVRFFLEKSEIEKKELKNILIPKEEIVKSAFNFAVRMHASYVLPVDIFAAYLTLTEEKTKLLFAKKLKEEDVLNILYWSRKIFEDQEFTKRPIVDFWGEGIAESWVYGWTIETKKYALDLTSSLLSKQVNIFDRTDEYQRLVEALSINKSVLLIGEPGVGKKALISKFLTESFSEKLKGNLYHQRTFQLMIDAFLAGAQNQGELEQRLGQIINELSHSGNIIIFVQDFENILGASSFQIDLSGALIPYIEKGVIRFIATTTNSAYKKFIESRHELLSSFEVINIKEPDHINGLLMLFISAIQVEKELGISLSYRAVLSSLENADKYNKSEILPGSAISLLTDSANSVRLRGKRDIIEQDVLDQISKKIDVPVGEPTKEEKKLLLNLENQIHKRVIGQEEAVKAVSEGMRRLRSGLSKKNKPISFLFLGPTGVGKTETAKALAENYYGAENRMLRLDMSEYATEEGAKRLLGSLPGEEEQPGELTDKIYDNPYTLVLLDEFEKADPKILNLFLQVFDDGRLTDNKGKTVSFANSIIIATSNAGSEFIRENIKNASTLKERLLEELQTKGLFKPELLNRFDDVIVFKPLDKEQIIEVVKLLLEKVKKTMLDKDVGITFGNER
ncbi:AAA family ATPase [Patescibacteria group bacterium]|nr:AAA family ATPase [Patescibacteria group bacterium]